MIQTNTLTSSLRRRVNSAIVGAYFVTLLGVFVVWGRATLQRRRGHTSNWVENIQSIAELSSPGILAAWSSLLLRQQLWVDHSLEFVCALALVTVALAPLVRLSLRTAVRLELWKPVRAKREEPSPLLGAGNGSFPTPSRGARVTSWLPIAVVMVGAVGYSVYFSCITVWNHWNLRTSSFDLGIFDNLMWQLTHGGRWFRASPLTDPANDSQFASHATLFAYLILPFYKIWPRPETLLVAQATFIGFGSVSLYLFARRYVAPWTATVLSIAYLLSPAVHSPNLYEYHFLAFAPTFIWLAWWAAETCRPAWVAVLALVAMSVREDVIPHLVIVGAYLLLSGRRWRIGLVLAIAAALCFWLVKFVWMPRYAPNGAVSFTSRYSGLIPADWPTMGGLARTLVLNPRAFTKSMLDPLKLIYVLQLLVPLAFLPVRQRWWWLLFLPGVFFCLLATDYPQQYSITFHYVVHFTTFAFAGTVIALAKLKGTSIRSQIQYLSALCCLVVSSVLFSHQFGVVLQQETCVSGYNRFIVGRQPKDLEREQQLKTLIARIPSSASVVASETLVPQVSGRYECYTLRIGVNAAEYLLFESPLYMKEDHEKAQALLKSKEYGVVEQLGDFVLAKRNYPADRNAAVLEKI